ncbi:MAG: hypothetical protein KC549_05835, partial [Myxococcales bacterium]|nr:hypothetical protein [Myxococcales bacterium]
TQAPDPPPRLARVTTPRPAEVLAPVAVEVDARQVAGGAVYLRVAMPAKMDALLPRLSAEARLIVEGDAYGFAVPAADGRVADRPLAYVRFPGGQAPDRFTLTWHQPAPAGGVGARQQLEVSGAQAADASQLVEEGFLRAASQWFDRRGARGFMRFEPFYAFAAARLELLGEALRPGGDVGALRQRRRGDIGEAMALYTGWTSIEEALQADRGLRTNPDPDSALTVALADVRGIALPGHPWEALQAKQATAPVTEPLAAFAPADMLYVHFHDLRQLVRLAADADELLTPVARTIEEQSGARHFTARYERQLIVQRSALSQALGHVAVQGVALVASDPFFRDGTDVSVLFHIRSEAALDQALGVYEAAARKRRPDLVESTWDAAGHPVRLLATADGEIHQHRLTLDGVRILSNSAEAVRRIVDAHEGRRPSLEKSGDFRYFRTIYPFGVEAEDGFVFISDAFVQHAISPRTKILQGRRMEARAALQAAGFAALLHGWLQGRRPADTAELLKSGLATAADLKDPWGGAIALDAEEGPASATWGRPARMVPLIELPLEKVSRAEEAAYATFRETYQAYWRGFIDPVGVRIKRDAAGGLALDARILPLIQQSDYNELARLVGDVRMDVQAPREGLAFQFTVAPDSRLRKSVEDLGRELTDRRDIGLGWLGDRVSVGVEDRSSLWDLALAMGEIPAASRPEGIDDRDARKQIFARAPVYVTADIADGLALAAALTAIKAFVASAAPGVVEWKTTEPYREVPIVQVQERFDGDGLSIYYATANRQLIFSLDPGTLHARIDAALDGERGKTTRSPRDAEGQAQAVLTFAPRKGGWLGKTILGMLERGVANANVAASRAYEALAVGRRELPADEDARRAVALAWLGQEPINAHGGAFSIGGDGLVAHSLYGTEVEPKWPELPVAGSPTAAFLDQLEGLQLTIGYEGGEDDRGLHTTVRWQRRP